MGNIPNLSNPSRTTPVLGAYAAPQLIEYGTLREVTLTVGNMGNTDGGTAPTNRTQP
jgi:hypothetical protein